MRLRHKKPLNSYIGQTNLDTSSAHDEDFERNNRPSRKQKFIKPKPLYDQTKKYGEILCDLITSVNRNYQNFAHQSVQQPTISPTSAKAFQRKLQIEPLNSFPPPPPTVRNQTVSKQQSIRKQESLSQRLPPRTKKICKERHIIEETPKRREQKVSQLMQNQVNLQNPLKPTLPPKTIDLTEGQKSQNNTQAQVKVGENNQFPNMYMNPFMAGMGNNMFNPFQLQMMMMGFPDQMKMNQNMMNIGQFQNPLNYLNFFNSFGLPGMQNGQGSQGAQDTQNNFIPFNKLPFFNQDNKSLPQIAQQLKQFQQAQQKQMQQAQQRSQAFKTINQAKNPNPANQLQQKRSLQPQVTKNQPQKPQNFQNEVSFIPNPSNKPKTTIPSVKQLPQPMNMKELPDFKKKQSNHIQYSLPSSEGKGAHQGQPHGGESGAYHPTH